MADKINTSELERIEDKEPPKDDKLKKEDDKPKKEGKPDFLHNIYGDILDHKTKQKYTLEQVAERLNIGSDTSWEEIKSKLKSDLWIAEKMEDYKQNLPKAIVAAKRKTPMKTDYMKELERMEEEKFGSPKDKRVEAAKADYLLKPGETPRQKDPMIRDDEEPELIGAGVHRAGHRKIFDTDRHREEQKAIMKALEAARKATFLA